MSVLLMEVATGTIDGVNVSFETATDYISGTVRAFTPVLQKETLITETGGKGFDLPEAPLDGDLVYVLYRSIV